ncbi:nitrate- and nitrite sensing domain-containing protein [Nonomuraea sp. NBC_01738]|uniref:sensor histidine kinase n=1 Tax=Nonomuraea sp. NBC_01738 TaxID=2976003 RepID=UPI002E138678|nr:nitrate- and nitrite sensing domain-containing protein [Nonomuraea sp. NBC_01738]
MLLLPLLSLSALWGFVLNLTVGDGRALLRANTIYQAIGVTSTDLGLQLQGERTRSVIAATTRKLTEDLGEQRARTDKAVGDFQKAAVEVDGDISDEMRASVGTLNGHLGRLSSIRGDIDSGNSSRLNGMTEYNRVLDSLFRLYDQMVSVPDMAIFQQAAAMQSMGNAREIIAREQALVSGALIDGRLTEAEVTAFTEYVASRKFLYARGMAVLDVGLREPYEKMFAAEPFLTFTLDEARIVKSGKAPADAAGWNSRMATLTERLDKIGLTATGGIAERATEAATSILVRIGMAGGVGLIAVVASILISVRFGRRLAGELADLRAAALDLSEVRLPRVVRKLRDGEAVDVKKEAKPIKVSGSAEITDVAGAFGSVQRTAVEAAVGQAELRQGVGQVFLNLARRKQGLLHRQLTLLDAMQRRTHDPDRLEELFRLDHLTTRMRRHAEGLIILSGAAPGRAWRKPVPVLDVVRAAIAEVEDYSRIDTEHLPVAALDGGIAADLTHLVAELVENATIYSPPDTTVIVRGDMVSNGYVIEVEDRGLGLAPDVYALVNARLADPPEFDLADSDRLGLFVVAKLARRHGIQVTLRASPFGGTGAIVLIPRKLVTEQDALAAPAPADAPEELPSRTGKKPLAVVGGGHHNGLPRRVRQTNLSPKLSPPPAPEPESKPERSPDEVRDLFSAFQRGTQRARQEEDNEGDDS